MSCIEFSRNLHIISGSLRQKFVKPSNLATIRSLSRNSGIAQGIRASEAALSKYERIASGTKSRKTVKAYSRNDKSVRQERPGMGSDNTGYGSYRSTDSMIKRATKQRPSATETPGARRVTRDETPDYLEKLPIPIPYTTAASVFVIGTRAATMALQAKRRKIHKVLFLEFSDGLRNQLPSKSPREVVVEMARSRNIPSSQISTKLFWQILRSQDEDGLAQVNEYPHDGIILEASPIPQPPIASLGKCNIGTGESSFELNLAYQTREDIEINGTNNQIAFDTKYKKSPVVAWLHGVVGNSCEVHVARSNDDGQVDQRNLGAILRSALFFGIDAVLLSKRATASLSPGSLRASAGAADYVPIYTVADPESMMRASQDNDWVFVATTAPKSSPPKANPRMPKPKSGLPKQDREPFDLNRTAGINDAGGPIVLILGGERDGLPDWMVQRADANMTIQSRSPVVVTAGLDSINVGVAAGIMFDKFTDSRFNGRDNQRLKSEHDPLRSKKP